MPAGVYIDCDLDSLVEEVVVSPLMAMHTYQALDEITKKLRPTIAVRKSILLTKEDVPLAFSGELSVMWEHYVRTRRVLDIDQIPNPAPKSRVS